MANWAERKIRIPRAIAAAETHCWRGEGEEESEGSCMDEASFREWKRNQVSGFGRCGMEPSGGDDRLDDDGVASFDARRGGEFEDDGSGAESIGFDGRDEFLFFGAIFFGVAVDDDGR